MHYPLHIQPNKLWHILTLSLILQFFSKLFIASVNFDKAVAWGYWFTFDTILCRKLFPKTYGYVGGCDCIYLSYLHYVEQWNLPPITAKIFGPIWNSIKQFWLREWLHNAFFSINRPSVGMSVDSVKYALL